MDDPAELMSATRAVTMLALAVPLLGGIAAALGVISWVRIRRSGGRLRGRPLAIAALVIGVFMLLISPIVLIAAQQNIRTRAKATVRSGDEFPVAAAETQAPLAKSGTASTAPPPPPAAARTWSWLDAFKSMGLLGVLVVLVGLMTLLFMGVGAFCEKLLWLPLVVGILGLFTGVLGTILGMIHAFSAMAALGGAANPADLSEGVSKSMITTLMGVAVLLLGVLGTAGLAVFHGLRRPSADLEPEAA